jgi:hypothetical protein
MSDARQTRVVQAARSHIGSDAWSFWHGRESVKGNFGWFESKCNLFVAEMLYAGGFNVPMWNQSSRRAWIWYTWKKLIEKKNLSKIRPPCANEWYNGIVPGTTLIGSGSDGLNRSWPGDIVCSIKHVGIISGPQKTISASSNTYTIVENDWAWRRENWHEIRVYRYHP